MMRSLRILFVAAVVLMSARAQETAVRGFDLAENDLTLTRRAQVFTPFDNVGRKFAILGTEGGSFEAWAYPLKLFRNAELSFLIGSSTEPIRGRDIVRFISASPEATVLTFTAQSFTVRALFVTPVWEPGALVLLGIESTEPLAIICSFLPVLQPMWPAGIGGQYARWDPDLKAYLISEPTRKNHAYFGSPDAEGISYTPAHMLSDAPSQFTIRITDPGKARGRLVPIVMAGGKGLRDSVRAVYQRLWQNAESLYRSNVEHYSSLRRSTLQVVTPVEELNRAFEWAKVAYDNLIVENPDLGRGMVAGLAASGTSGRPGFGWFFGGDTYINAFSLNSYGATATVRDAIAFTQKFQRDDGKMPHEVSQAAGYVRWFEDYPYAYIHGDTSPFYLVAMHDYYRATGDRQFVVSSWESLRRAYEWALATDGDGDGLMDNRKAGLGALEYGPLTDIQSDIYASAVWVRGVYAMQSLARAAGQEDFAKKAARQYERSLNAFRQKFWDAKRGQYAYAFNSKGEHVDVVSPWSSVALHWGLGEDGKSLASLEKLNGAELTTDWGIRSISDKSPYYEPLNYNYGAVWPFLNSWVAAAQYRHRLALQGYSTLMASVRHSFDNALGKVTEVFSGSANIWPQEAVSHQGFSSAGVVLPFVRGLLGLDGDAIGKVVTFAPQVPADWDSLLVLGYAVGDAKFNFRYQRTGERLSVQCTASKADGYRARIELPVPKGARWIKTSLDGSPVDCPATEYASDQVVSFELKSVSGSVVELEYEPTVEILPPEVRTATGEANSGLKILSCRREGRDLVLTVEGLAGKRYGLGLRNAQSVASSRGGTVQGSTLVMDMPPGAEREFVRTTVTLTVNEAEQRP